MYDTMVLLLYWPHMANDVYQNGKRMNILSRTQRKPKTSASSETFLCNRTARLHLDRHPWSFAKKEARKSAYHLNNRQIY